MKSSRLFAAAALVFSGVAACGGSGSTSVSDAAYTSASPSYDRFGLAQSDADSVEPTEAATPSSGLQLDAQAAATPDCHPHLFERSHEIIARVNRHLAKHLRHIEDVIQDHPALKADGTHVWESVKAGVDRRFTMTATTNADGSETFTYLLEVATAAATPSFVTVLNGDITVTSGAAVDGGAASVSEEKGTIMFDFTALSTVVTSEKARGQISDAFDHIKDPVKGIKRTANLTLTNFLPEEGDPHGPRNGGYVWEREPSIGGSLAFQDTLVLLCTSNPNALTSDLTAVARWYKTAAGSVNGRTDAQATGGQLPTGNAWLGVTCATGPSTATPAEGYWMVKQEDSTGATVTGTAHANTTGVACDPVFGTTPSLTSNANDFVFTGISFTMPFAFPGQW